MNISTRTDPDARFASARAIGSRPSSGELSRRWSRSSASSPTPAPQIAPGRFVIEPWARTDASGAPGGGGRMAMLRGRLFEKMGAHTSVVHGAFPPEFAEQIPGADRDPRFWAAGVSVIAHPWSPHVPTVHMNTRLVRTTKTWFGGGADLTPMLDKRRKPDDPDAIAFHAAMRAACERHPGVADAEKLQKMVRRIFLSQAPQRAARHRRHLLRLSQQRRMMKAIPPSTPISASCAMSARVSLRSIAISSGATPGSRGAKPSARNNWPGAGVMSSSTCSMTGAQFLA